MNESEIDRAVELIGSMAPEYLPYAEYLSDWRHTVNANSDGWPYWTAASRAATRLQEYIQEIIRLIRGGASSSISARPTVEQLKKALVPIKSLATKKKLEAPTLRDLSNKEAMTDQKARTLLKEIAHVIRRHPSQSKDETEIILNVAAVVEFMDPGPLRAGRKIP